MKAAWGVAYKVACGVCLVWLLIVLGVVVHYGWRALVADTFVIPSDSMSPTLLPGDKVRVDKTIFGARLYTSLDFSDGRMESIRTRGRRGLRYNDIVVFNYPVNDKGRIGFKMNYVYVKRVVALPGDTIAFVHSRPVNSHYEGALGLAEAQRRLEETPDSLIPWYAMRNILVETAVLGYTIKDIPPVYVPRRGDILRMDDWRKVEIYRRAIEWETGRTLAWDGEPVGRSAFVVLPFPEVLLFRMRRYGLRVEGLALLGLRAGRIHRGRGGPCSGVAPSRDGA